MELLRRQAFARAGLMGNPSDGYGGKTISIVIRNFAATVVLYEWDEIEIVFTREEQSCFDSVHDLVKDVRQHGYYGAIRLLKATIKKFVEYCDRTGRALHDRKFAIRHESNIPRQVGLAGSSAIITATLRCLMDFYQVTIPMEVLPSLALSVEVEELGIAAGLQDRVIQAYEGMVYMDFDPTRVTQQDGLRVGVYERLPLDHLPPLYLSYSADDSEPTEVVHNDLRARYNQGDPAVHAAMQQFASFAAAARSAILARDAAELARLMDANFDLRASLLNIPKGQKRMVEVARSVGASAKFTGSGGAIVGTYTDDGMFGRLQHAMAGIGCLTVKPNLG